MHRAHMQWLIWLGLLAGMAGAGWAEAPAPEELGATGLKTVVVEGVGANPDRAKARDDAIADAQRRAVEQAVGLFVKSDTLVENFTLIEDSIYRHSQGYVHTYEVVSERYSEGECRATIRAEVRTGRIEQDLDDIWERLRVAGSPRVIVAIDQPQPSDVPGIAQAAVTEKLVVLGFKVIDEHQLAEARWKEAVKLMRARKAREADILRLQEAGDIVVTGEATYRSLGRPEPELEAYSCEAAFDGRAVRTDTAEVLAAARVTVPPRPAFREDQAIEAALRAVADEWLTRNLGMLVKAAVDPARSYTITLVECLHSDLEAVDRQLRELRFVRRTTLRAYDGGVAQLEVEFVGTAQRLASEMGAFSPPRLDIGRITASTIMARVSR